MKTLQYFKVVLAVLVLFYTSKLVGNEVIDSLQHELKIAQTTDDSARSASRLAYRYAKTDTLKVIYYSQLAFERKNQIKEPWIKALAYDAKAFSYFLQNDIGLAKKLYIKSLDIGVSNNLSNRIAWGYYHLTNMLIHESKFDSAAITASKSYHNFLRLDNKNRALNPYWLMLNASQTNYADTLIFHLGHTIDTAKNENDLLFGHLQLASLYTVKENRNQAMKYVQIAMEIADQNQNLKGILKAYLQIAGYFKDYQKDYETALVYYEKVLDIKLKNQIWGLGTVYLEIGELHRLNGNDSLALVNFNTGLEYGLEQQHRHTIASAYEYLGNLNYQNRQFNNALYNYQKCYNTGCNTCPQIKFHNPLLKIGNIYLLSNEKEKAYTYYNKSFKLAQTSNSHRETIKSLMAFGKFYESNNKLTKAIEYYAQAHNIAKKHLFLDGQLSSAQALQNAYKQNKQYPKAYNYLSIANKVSDSIQKRSEADNLASLETHFDFKNLQIQQELEKAIADKQLSQQKMLRNFLLVGFVLVLLFGLVILSNYKRKKRDNQLLHEKNKAIETMSAKVHQADEAKLQFYTNVSHELRTPLTIILGLTENLMKNFKDNQNVNGIRKHSLKLLQLINHLLDLRKFDESKMELRVQKGNIRKFIDGQIALFESYASKKNITIQTHYATSQLFGYFDQQKFEKIFSNLLSNAIKYTPEHGQVAMFISMDSKGNLLFEIKDTGCGIAKEDIDKIFNRFYRANHNEHAGSGIGLALVKELTEKHKGFIQVWSNPPEGSCFKITIPVLRKHYLVNEIVTEEQIFSDTNFAEIAFDNDSNETLTHNNLPPNDGKCALIVEDNNDLRQYIAGIFNNEFHVLQATNGADGFDLAQKYVPDIVISDIVMPKLNGIQLVEKIKHHQATSHIPVILLTAKHDLGSRINSFDKGADDFISKPFESMVLKARVENLIRLRNQLAEKFTKQYNLQPRSITIDDSEKIFLDKTVQTIEKHIDEQALNVDFLAMELNVSRTQLYRKIKALTDYSPNQFIRIIRLKRAAQILKQGQNNIAEVMDATGFSNYSHFNNCFKDYFGEFPKDYALLSVKGVLN